MSPDLSRFTELNDQGKVAWEKRAALIHEQFPAVNNLDWNKAFANDLDLFARVVRDILKADQAGPSRPGPRPALDYDKAARRLREFVSDEYTTLPFHEVFQILADGRSVRALAAKTQLNRNQVHRLLTAQIPPDVYSMRQVAVAFGKKPQFFLEYRQIFILSGLMARLESAPEATVGIYKKLSQAVA